jgi:hypothetical protein
MSGMKEQLLAMALPAAAESAFEELLDDSLAAAYFGASEPHCGPVDAGRARRLLREMWGELIREDALQLALARFLDRHGATPPCT